MLGHIEIYLVCYKKLCGIYGAEVSNKSTVFQYVMYAMQILMSK